MMQPPLNVEHPQLLLGRIRESIRRELPMSGLDNWDLDRIMQHFHHHPPHPAWLTVPELMRRKAVSNTLKVMVTNGTLRIDRSLGPRSSLYSLAKQ